MIVNDNDIVVYKELYHRHLHSKLAAATTENRFDAFHNYIDLFDMIIGLNAESPELELPAGWLWDIIDEFISQFQSFHQFRSRVSSLTTKDCMTITYIIIHVNYPIIHMHMHVVMDHLALVGVN